MNMRLHKFQFLAVVLLSSVSAGAMADDAALEQRVQTLEQQVRELNRRFNQQELPAAADPGMVPAASNAAASAVPIDSGPPGWQSAGNWKKMRAGMNQDQVLDLLGEPERRSGGKYRLRWEYANGGSWVEFDSGAEVNEWQAP
jgi:hypothetical protein